MEAKLVVIGGLNPGQEIAITGGKFVIGRGEDCQLRPRSPMVSRRHCAILLEEGQAAVEDFGSKNGTFVNGEPVSGRRELKAGDRLGVGPLEFEVHLTVALGGKKRPKVRSVQEAAARTVEAARPEEMEVTQWIEDEEDEDDTMSTSGQSVNPPAPKPEETNQRQPSADELRSTKRKPDSSSEAAANVFKQLFKPKS